MVEAAKATALHANRLALFEMHLQPLPSGHVLNTGPGVRCWTGTLWNVFFEHRQIADCSRLETDDLVISFVRWREWFRLVVRGFCYNVIMMERMFTFLCGTVQRKEIIRQLKGWTRSLCYCYTAYWIQTKNSVQKYPRCCIIADLVYFLTTKKEMHIKSFK